MKKGHVQLRLGRSREACYGNAPSMEDLDIASDLFECEHFVNTQLERIGYLLQTLGRHAAILRSFIALYLLLG